MTNKMSRREMVLRALQVPIGGAGLLALAACGGSGGETKAAACADPGAINEGEQGMRTAVDYVEQSADPSKVCAGCSYFHPGDSGSACGKCDMFSGGAVNPQGHCNSWNARG
jgi:hypothetical protein